MRELRIAAQALEADLGRLAMAPAVALSTMAAWNLREARLALRRLDRHAAKADDPRLGELKPLRAQIRDRRAPVVPRRKKHRCTACFLEVLLSPTDLRDCPRSRWGPGRCDGVMEPVAPLRRARP